MAEKKLLISVKMKLAEARQGFKSLAQEAQQTFGGMASKAKSSAISIKSAFFSIPALIGSVFSAATAKAAIDVSILEEKVTNAMTAAAGGAEAAAKELEFVRSEANRLGFEYLDLAKSYTKLVAASKGTNLEGQKTRDIFLGISEAARSMSLDTQETTGILRAVEQMMSKGTVQAEELRGQLGEHLPGAFQIASRAMGVTTAELSKMLEKGEVTAEQLLPKMAQEMRNTASTNLGSALADTSAEVARFQDFIKSALAYLDDKTGLTYHFRSAMRAAREFGGEILGLNESRALEIFREKIEPNIDVLRRFGIAVDSIDPSNLKDVNRILKAIELNNIDLEVEGQLASLSKRIDETGRSYSQLKHAISVLNPENEEQARVIAGISTQMVIEEQKIQALVKAYMDLAQGKQETEDAPDEVVDTKAIDDAKESIDKLVSSLELQNENYGKAQSKILAYRLQHGDLKDEVAALGVEGKLASQKIVALAKSIEEQAESEKAAAKALADKKAAMQEAQQLMDSTRTDAERYADVLDRINELYEAGFFGAVGSAEAIANLNKVITATADKFKDVEETGESTFDALTNAVHGWGREFTDTLADAVITGKFQFKDLADSIIRDLLRIQIQQRLTNPLVQGGTSFLNTLFDESNTTASANGNVMTSGGPLPLQKYAKGGIARSPQLSIFGEGSQPEAYVPLPDGRTIPVTMKGAGAATGKLDVSVNMNNTGTPQQVTDTSVQFDGERMIVDVVIEDIRGGGPIGQELRSRGMR